MPKAKVQEIFRSMPWAGWVKGDSICYRDTSYTQKAKKVRFNFQNIENKVDESTRVHGSFLELAQELRAALEAAGHEVDTVLVYKNSVMVYQKFPVTIIEE